MSPAAVAWRVTAHSRGIAHAFSDATHPQTSLRRRRTTLWHATYFNLPSVLIVPRHCFPTSSTQHGKPGAPIIACHHSLTSIIDLPSNNTACPCRACARPLPATAATPCCPSTPTRVLLEGWSTKNRAFPTMLYACACLACRPVCARCQRAVWMCDV